MIELNIWKYNESGTIPKYMLLDMADNSSLSLAAIGAMVVMYYSQTPTAQGELDQRAGGNISKLFDELKKLQYVPTDEMVKTIESEQS